MDTHYCDLPARNTSPVVIYAIAVLMVLDAQLRRVEADASSLAKMDAIMRRISMNDMAELGRCLNRASELIEGALK